MPEVLSCYCFECSEFGCTFLFDVCYVVPEVQGVVVGDSEDLYFVCVWDGGVVEVDWCEISEVIFCGVVGD